MSMAKKVLFNAPDNGRSIEGLISSLQKTSPGGMAELKDRGGRLGGQAMADDHEGAQVDPNSAATMNAKKIC